MGDEDVEKSRVTKSRKLRPEIQIYRPPASKGVRRSDSQSSLASNTDSRVRPKPEFGEDKTDRRDSGSTTPDAATYSNIKSSSRRGKDQKPFNSTQSLIEFRRGDNKRPPKPSYQTPFERSHRKFDQRASMRSDGAMTNRRNQTGRRRNDSFNSTRSDFPQTSTTELNIDTEFETRSQCAPTFTSIESIENMFDDFSSMDWSKIVEEEDLQRMKNEEEQAKKSAKTSNEQIERSNDLPRGMIRVDIRKHEARGNDRNRFRRHDSDRSSLFGGSIAEEEYDDSGEITPTSYRAKSPNEWKTDVHDRVRVHKRNEEGFRPRYRGEHDDRYESDVYKNKEVPKSSRLSGRLMVVKPRERVPVKSMVNDNRRYGDEEASTSKSNGGQVASEKQKRSSPELQTVGLTIQEAREIEEKSAEMERLFPSVSKKRNADAARRLVELSSEMAAIFQRVLTDDILYTFTKNVEPQLFKQAFYKPIEHLRTGANSSSPGAKAIRVALEELLVNGIEFYNYEINKYTETFGILLENHLVWPQGVTPDDFGPFILRDVSKNNGTKERKYAVRSLSRIFVCIGDLHRYKTMVDGSEDYSIARCCYQKACQLWPESGHSFNQLGVLAAYSMLYRSTRRARLTPIDVLSKQRQERVQEEIFNLMRALSAPYKFDVSKERLKIRLAAIRSKVAQYEPSLDTECGKMVDNDVCGERQREIWLKEENREVMSAENDNVFVRFQSYPASKVHRRATAYIVDTVGLLVTKIGMDCFQSVSERAFALLSAAIEQSSSLFTSIQLTQLTSMFIYAVTVSSSNEGSNHMQLAVRSLFSLFSVFLTTLTSSSSMSAVEKVLNERDEELLTQPVRNILPPLTVISEWILADKNTDVYKMMPTLDPLPSSILELNLDDLLTKTSGIGLAVEQTETESFSFPEHVYLSCFCPLFANVPRFNGNALTRTVERLRRVKKAVEHLQEVRSDISTRQRVDSAPSEAPSVGSPPVDPQLTRDSIIDLERRKNTTVMVVRPEFILPDTNAIIDHLEVIQNILSSKKFELLISTIVINELEGLAQTSDFNDSHGIYLRTNALKAIKWLKTEAKSRNDYMKTLTTSGAKVQLFIAGEEIKRKYGDPVINDDLIIQSCSNLAIATPAFPVPSDLTDQHVVTRSIVILTEDRGLTIKAINQKIPCRTVHSFSNWIFGNR